MGRVAQLVGGAVVLMLSVLSVVVWPAAASAAPGDDGLRLELRTAQPSYGPAEPVRLTFAITNASGAPCGLSSATEGTVQVTSVRRDGQELVPALGRSFYLDGITSGVRAAMVTAAPGSTVDIAVAAVRLDDGQDPGSVVLRSVTGNPDGTGLDTFWPVGAPGRYEVTAAYAVPEVDGADRPCAGATAARTVEFTIGDSSAGLPWRWVLIGGGGLLVLLVLIALVVIVLRRRRHGAAAAALLVLVGLIATVGSAPRPAHADVTIEPDKGLPVDGVDFTKEVNGCFAQFSAPGGDPAGVMSRLKDPNTPLVRIRPTTGESQTFETPASKAGKGSSTIVWHPNSTEPYSDGVARDPCAALYHELSHADDISKDTVPTGDCGDTGIKSAEVKATLAENQYRKAKGLPARTEYKGNKLPKSMDECKKPKKKTPPPKGPVKLCEGAGTNQCGSTNGDPHLVTFDRAYYDFQAAGEFVVVRATAGDPLEVQARQVPMGSSRRVSVNSAVALRVGSSKVELSMVDGVTIATIDGRPAELARGERPLPGGGTIERRESDISSVDGYDVRWPDGSGAAVDQIGHYGLRLLLRLATARAGKVEGLLGNFDGDPENDIAPRGGTPLEQPVPFDRLYPSYADSWRIQGDQTLFTYAAGQSTATFTDRAFPDQAMAVTDLDPAARATAEEICRWAGVVDPWQFLECVFDVGVTGRSEFAVSSASSEAVAPPVAAPIAATPIAAGTLTVGGTDRLTFAGRAGQAVFVDVVAPTLPSQCSPFRLLDPAGAVIATGCNINGTGYIDRAELPVDGTYTVRLDPRDETTGRATARVYLAADTNGAIEPNGPATTTALEQPGSLATYRFAGTAGQRVFVDVPESTLPDQCSPLELRDAAGKPLASGCVINGAGDLEGTVLPATGTYTVLVDPRNRTTGTVQLRLYAAVDRAASIAIGGPPVVVTIDQPGAVTRLTFSGTAGTSVRLTATDATLPDQCSPLELLDPAGEFVISSCVINGEGGFDRATLPTTGGYTLVVDPRGAGTGAVTLTLRAST